MATNIKPMKLMTLEERREYSRIKQREFRERKRSDPTLFAEYKAKRARHVAKYRERLERNPVLFAEHRARKRAQDRLRKARACARATQ